MGQTAKLISAICPTRLYPSSFISPILGAHKEAPRPARRRFSPTYLASFFYGISPAYIREHKEPLF